MLDAGEPMTARALLSGCRVREKLLLRLRTWLLARVWMSPSVSGGVSGFVESGSEWWSDQIGSKFGGAARAAVGTNLNHLTLAT